LAHARLSKDQHGFPVRLGILAREQHAWHPVQFSLESEIASLFGEGGRVARCDHGDYILHGKLWQLS
jgi:hypothetical protein